MHLDGVHLGIRVGSYVGPDELTAALRRQGERPAPSEITDYNCRMLEGTVKKPKGRKGRRKLNTFQRDMLIRGAYRRYQTATSKEATLVKSGLPFDLIA